jgi:hypothetical protein
MSEVVLTLPDSLAKEAKANGLLAPEFVASLFRAELRRRRVNKLFAASDRLADLDEPHTEAEIAAEIGAARKQRRRS